MSKAGLKANEELTQLPNSIPGVYKVIKIIEPGAEYCLVHILNLHFAKGLDDKKYRLIEDVQQNNYSILKYLIYKISLKEVYQEGKIQDWRKNSAISRALIRKKVFGFFKALFRGFKDDRDDRLKFDAVERLKREGLLVILTFPI